jgi:ribonuclease HI
MIVIIVNLMSDPGSWTLRIDGACSQNLGSGAGVVLDDQRGERLLCQKNLGNQLTCNEAEYTTLIFGLEIALKLGIVRIKVQGDSKLVCS